MNQKREYAFDILRVISMIMVITIHVANVYSRSYGMISNSSYLFSLIFNTISRVSVPIFLMISGALLLDRKFEKKKYWKRLWKYILLIIVWDSIYLLWEYFYLGVTYDKLYKLLLEPYRAHLWFLYTILVLYFVQPLLKWILDRSNKTIKIILLLIWFLLSSASLINSYIANYFTIFSYIGYFILGKYVYDYAKEKDLKKYNIIGIIIMIICFSLSILLNYNSSIKYNRFYNLYFAYRTPFIMLASISLYAMVITNYQKDTLRKEILMLSDLSLGVYLIHGIFLDVTIKEFTYYMFSAVIGIPLFTMIIFMSSIISVFLLRKIKFIKDIV